MKNYFKKFSIMFVLLLAIIGINMIQNRSVANAASNQITWNINDKSTNISLSSDSLTTIASGGGNSCVRATQGKSSGKWYWEIKVLNGSGSVGENEIGVGGLSVPLNNFYFGDSIQGYSYYDYGRIHNGTNYASGQSVAKYYEGDIIGIALNLDDNNGELTFFKNGVQQGLKYTNIKGRISGDIYPMVGHYRAPNSVVANFGLISFKYPTPIGYLPYDSSASIVLVKSISLNKATDNLQVGQTDNLTATTTPASVGVTWTSSDSSIATVDSNGKVTGIKEGQSTITATTTDGATATCTVTVTNTSGTSGGNTTPTNPTDTNGGTSTGTDETSTIVNIAHAKGDNTNNAGGEVSIIFHGTADTTLSVVKTADVKEVWVGDKFIYTIVVTNTGSKTAKAVVVNDTAPNHIQFIPSGITTTQGTVDSTSTPSNIVVNVGDIPPSGTVTIKVPVNVVL